MYENKYLWVWGTIAVSVVFLAFTYKLVFAAYDAIASGSF